MNRRYYSGESNRSCYSGLRNNEETMLRKSGQLIFALGKEDAVRSINNHFRTEDYRISRNGTAYMSNSCIKGPYYSAFITKAESSGRRFLFSAVRIHKTSADDLRITGALSGTRNTG